MAKERKTRKQKQVADNRKTTQGALSPNQQPGTYSYSFQPLQSTSSTSIRTTTTIDHTYQFIITDLRKTFLTTLAIIAAQMVLFFMIKK